MIAAVVSGLVVLGFAHLSIDDARHQRVPVARAQALTALAVIGLGAVALVDTSWTALFTAVAGAALVFTLQLIPYRRQQRSSTEAIGRADLRLAVPFGWTLGFHGIGFVVVGFAAALLLGLAFTMTGRRRIPFVPFLTLGLIIGLTWAAVVAGAD